jgi:hypothetical protein
MKTIQTLSIHDDDDAVLFLWGFLGNLNDLIWTYLMAC